MAMLNNRKYIGFELSEEYCEIAEQRIGKHVTNWDWVITEGDIGGCNGQIKKLMERDSLPSR